MRNDDLILVAGIGALVFMLSRTDAGKNAIDEGVSVVKKINDGLTRGERNNNPGNIVRTGTAWLGMSADQSGDSRFIVFTSAEYGVRALVKVLRTYSANGVNTVPAIISRYAPDSENDTLAYINSVLRDTGFTSTQIIDVADDFIVGKLAKAIIKHENGRVMYADSTIAAGVALA